MGSAAVEGDGGGGCSVTHSLRERNESHAISDYNTKDYYKTLKTYHTF